MAIFDAMFEFMDDAEITGATTTLYLPISTWKELDWVTEDLEMGAGEPLWLNIRVGTTAYSSGTTDTDTADFKLFADDTSEGQDSSSVLVASSGPIAMTALTVGDWILRQPLRYNCDDERYLTIGATFSDNVSAGTIDAWIDHGPQSSYDTQVSASNIT